MKKVDIYEKCPEFDTKSFHLRLVQLGDAEDMLLCYSDRKAVERLNADHCTGDFYCANEEAMKQCIHFWLIEYENRGFVRLAILPKSGDLAGKAVGTIELFGGEYGVLRIDLASDYDSPETIGEIVKLAIDRLVGLLSVQTLVVKVSNVPERIPVLENYGFVPSDFRESGYMEWKRSLHFKEDMGIAVCGLACCICSSNDDCKGCRTGGCKERDWCKAYHCWIEKGTDKCLDCENYVCDFPIINKNKTKAMLHIIKEFGQKKLMECLERNEKQGINYHYFGEYFGDYDCATEEEAYDLILKGWEE